jgi:hypothetical protein
MDQHVECCFAWCLSLSTEEGWDSIALLHFVFK